MTSASPMPQPQAPRTTDDWRTISDELIQGLVHALNNRVAALSAFVELAKLGDEEGNPLTVLPAEIAQLQRVNALFGLLPERRSEPEALELRGVLDDAIRLHAHHPRLRAEELDVTFDGAADAVRAPRWALLRTLVMLVHAAKRAGESVQGRGGGAIGVVSDEAKVTVHVGARVAPSAELTTLAERCGGKVTTTHDGLMLTLPSLREVRRREREGAGVPPD